MNSDTHYDLILKNGKVVLPEGTAEVNIGIKNDWTVNQTIDYFHNYTNYIIQTRSGCQRTPINKT